MMLNYLICEDFPGGSDGKTSACNSGDPGLIPRSGRHPPLTWKREWQPTPVLVPGESRGQKSLVSYSPRNHKKLDMTERLKKKLFFIASF